jgi:hypothetical protein
VKYARFHVLLERMCTKGCIFSGMLQHFKTGGMNAAIQDVVNYSNCMLKHVYQFQHFA